MCVLGPTENHPTLNSHDGLATHLKVIFPVKKVQFRKLLLSHANWFPQVNTLSELNVVGAAEG
jgi:hypothetical protein